VLHYIYAMGILRKTKSVETILKIFEESNIALSVVDLVGKLGGKMNKTTVYRILQRLEDHGNLHSFLGKDGLKWFAKCKGCTSSHHKDAHPHFQCLGCGKTECLSVDISLPAILNHRVDSINLLMIGQCEQCLS